MKIDYIWRISLKRIRTHGINKRKLCSFLNWKCLTFFTDRLVTETLYQRIAEWIKLFTVLAFYQNLPKKDN